MVEALPADRPATLGYAPLGARPGTGYRSPRAHGTSTAVMLAIMAAITIVLAAVRALTAAAYGQGRFELDEPSAPELALACVSLPYLLGFILSAVCFLTWMHRVNGNIPALAGVTPRFSPGWAVGCWFVPIANLVWPYQAVREIWVASAPASRASARSLALPGWWWAAWLTSNIIGSISGRVSIGAKTAQVAAAAEWYGVLSDAISVAAALLAIVIVRRITADQEQRFAELRGAGGA